MDRLALVGLLVVAAVLVSLVFARRRPDPPTQQQFAVPAQLDRADFAHPEAPWLVVVFTSATCDTCAGVISRAVPLRSDQVAVQEVEYGADRALHDRYGIDAVPTLVVVDTEGVVRASFIGTVTSTDLWATVAELREPGTLPADGCDHGQSSA